MAITKRLPPQATATVVSDAARQRVLGDLSLSRTAVADAAASDRHRSIQIRRVRAEPIDQSDAQSRLLETWPPISRRRRIYDHPESVDRAIGIYRREPRHDLAIYRNAPAPKGRPKPGVRGDLRGGTKQRQQQPDRQPGRAAFSGSGASAGHGTQLGPQSVHRHSQRRAGRRRWRHATAARGCVGHAAGDPPDTAGLQFRCGKEPRRSAGYYEAARLRTRQPAKDQGVSPEHTLLP